MEITAVRRSVYLHEASGPFPEAIPDSIYRVPLQTPTATTRELKARAAKLELVMKDVHIKHPLVGSTFPVPRNNASSLHAVIVSSAGIDVCDAVLQVTRRCRCHTYGRGFGVHQS